MRYDKLSLSQLILYVWTGWVGVLYLACLPKCVTRHSCFNKCYL